MSCEISELEYGVFEKDLAPFVLSFLGQPKVHPSAEAVTSLLVTKRCMRFNLVNGIKTTRPLHAYELFHSLLLFLLSGCPFKIRNSCFFHPIFGFGFFVTFGDKVKKIQKYYVIFVSFLQGKMVEVEKNRKENRATKVNKIPKTKRGKYGMNETHLTVFPLWRLNLEQQFYDLPKSRPE